MSYSKRYSHVGITALCLLILFSIQSFAVGIDNTAVPPTFRFYKQTDGFVFGLAYATGGNPGFYDSEGNKVIEDRVEFDSNPDLSFFSEDVIKLLRDTMDRVDRLWDTEYTDISMNLGYGMNDLFLYTKLNFRMRSYGLSFSAVKYDPAFIDQLSIVRQLSFDIPIESDHGINEVLFGLRYTLFDGERIKLYVRPEGSLSLIPSEMEYFSNSPSQIYVPLGFVQEFDKFGFLVEGGYNLRESNMSNQIIFDGSLFLTSVDGALLYVDVRYLQSFDTDNTFTEFQEPFAPTYLTVAPGFDLLINQSIDLNFRLRVDLLNSNNYGMSRFSIGGSYILK